MGACLNIRFLTVLYFTKQILMVIVQVFKTGVPKRCGTTVHTVRQQYVLQGLHGQQEQPVHQPHNGQQEQNTRTLKGLSLFLYLNN